MTLAVGRSDAPAVQITSHTALRGLAALAVCWGHYTDVFARGLFLPHTHLGVDVFFLLSGFILYHVYGGQFRQTIPQASLGRFLMRRALRIYPLHLATLAMVIVLMRFEWPEDPAWQLFLHLSLTHAWGLTDVFVFNAPSWSISAEFAAYLAFPMMALCANRRLGRLGLLALAGAAALALAVLGHGSLDLAAIGRSHVLLRVFLGFPLGVLIAWAFQSGPRPNALQAGLLQALALAGIWLAFALGLAELWLILPFALLVYATAGDTGFLSPLLGFAPLHWLGKVSYGIYLLQWPVILFLFNLMPKLQPMIAPAVFAPVQAVIFGVLLLAGAAMSWRLVEAPMVRLGRAEGRRAERRQRQGAGG